MMINAFTVTSHFVQPTLMSYVPSLKAEKTTVLYLLFPIFCCRVFYTLVIPVVPIIKFALQYKHVTKFICMFCVYFLAFLNLTFARAILLHKCIF